MALVAAKHTDPQVKKLAEYVRGRARKALEETMDF